MADVQVATARSGELLPAPEVDYRRSVRIGLVGALTAIFVAANGMVEVLDVRVLVYPVLSLGYVTLLFAIAYWADNVEPGRYSTFSADCHRGSSDVYIEVRKCRP